MGFMQRISDSNVTKFLEGIFIHLNYVFKEVFLDNEKSSKRQRKDHNQELGFECSTYGLTNLKKFFFP